jgi:hypothetical protein
MDEYMYSVEEPCSAKRKALDALRREKGAEDADK